MESFEEHYASMCDAIKKHLPGADMALIDRAVDYANQKHKLQKRKDGSPYIIHPLAVAQIVAEMGLDCDAILGALLHDCIEDTDASHEDIEKIFGPTVAELVEGVTKLTRANFSSSEQAQMENLRKMFMAMSKDIRVVLIKIADRLHNMRTMQYQTPEKQIQKCRETMDVYAPLAHRLGMQKIKWELEDTALRYLAPMEYNEIMSYLQAHKEKDEAFMRTIQDKITQRLTSVGIHNTTYGRIKHVYSIYRKMLAQGKTIDELYDIYAFRVIVDTIPDCYNVLGHVHDLFSLVPGRFKDYISTPKPNMYQSLHTTVIDKKGIPFEIQIRTWEMHYTAEFGIAAHWKYKAGIQGKDKLEERLAWIRQMIENQQEAEGAEDIVKNIKNDLAVDDVFVFTPKGDVKSLPVGSTIVDFAYAIHTAVGNRMTGAKVDGRIVPLDYQLKTGEIVEILTSKAESGPNRNWLTLAKTSEARNKIRAWFKKERKEENVAEGRAEFERELKRNYIHYEGDEYQALLEALVKRYHRESVDDFYAAIGYGGIPLSKVMPRVKDDYVKQQKAAAVPVGEPGEVKPTAKKSSSGVIVEGINNCLVKFAQCCNPLPGDDVVGFITRGYGVSVHKRDCQNVQASMNDPTQRDRWVAVRWADNAATQFRSTLDIVAKNSNTMLADISVALANMRVPTHEFNARELKNGNINVLVTISTQGLEHLSSIIQKISKVPGVLSVERSGK